LITYLLRRVLQSIVVLLLVTMITFGLLRAIPGNAAVAVMGPVAYRNPGAIKVFDTDYGFNLPWYRQYLLWLGDLLRGNLGYSWQLNQSVASLLANRLPRTLLLVGPSVIVALAVAIPMGMVQAVRRNKPSDHVLNALSVIFYAAPDFLIAIVAILLLAVRFPIFPVLGPQAEGWALLANLYGLVLPVICLSLTTIALFSRYMRSSVLDNLTEDYVRTARAKGAGARAVLMRHVLRNSLITIATLLGLSLPGIFGGALVIEAVFSYQGMGYLFYQAAAAQDYPVLLGFTVVVAVMTVAGSLLADIAYAVLDPRVRYAELAVRSTLVRGPVRRVQPCDKVNVHAAAGGALSQRGHPRTMFALVIRSPSPRGRRTSLREADSVSCLSGLGR
jgi:peptide/nickel transport system permease protein